MEGKESQYFFKLNLTFNFTTLCGSFRFSCRGNELNFVNGIIMLTLAILLATLTVKLDTVFLNREFFFYFLHVENGSYS